MQRRIFGIEVEYGVTCTFRGQRRLSPDEVARYLFRRVVSWGRSSNVFLENGARLYLDVGSHPEYATPECDSVRGVVTHDKAGERILESLVEQAEQRLHEPAGDEALAAVRQAHTQQPAGSGEHLELRVPLELRYADGFAFRSMWLSAPIGMLLGLLFTWKLPFSERVSAISFMNDLRRNNYRIEPDLSVHDLLKSHGQDGRIGHYLWRPLCVSALNTPPEMASAQVFVNVLRDSLGGDDGASDLLLPRVDLSKLFPEPACEYVRQKQGEVRLNAPVKSLQELRDFGTVIVAVGPHQLKTLFPEIALDQSYQPIYTCYLKYPDNVRLRFPMLGFSSGLVQWAFDRGRLTGEAGLIACVISAQGDHQQMSRDELAAQCHRELKEARPQLPDAVWTQVIAEKRATIACVPGIKSVELKMNNIVFAGDYTYSDYPPTLEAAVRSGVRAARRALDS